VSDVRQSQHCNRGDLVVSDDIPAMGGREKITPEGGCTTEFA
jgi:hypothetical protein